MRTNLYWTAVPLGALGALLACEREPTKLDALLEASTMTNEPRDALVAPSPIPDAGSTAAAASDASTWDGSMPPRPIPMPSLTVGSGMPAEVQMKTIAYMAAMAQPRFDDAPADSAYAADLANQLKPVVLSFDKGAPEDKMRLDRVEVVASGRRIDLLMADGCSAELPRNVAQRVNASWVTLRSHGVLVLRCNDSRVQCLQSTRDPSDVLCTTAPRHR
jgi:hypothetical protein